jgi:very-short-patch-repair endonuclease
MIRETPQHDYAKARKLRREMSLPEVLLWRLLRKQPEGIKFRRQHPIGPYVIDFYSPAAKLGFEIDGIAHDMGDRPQQDVVRDAWISDQGIVIVRIAAVEALKSVDRVAEAIVRHAASLAKPLHHPRKSEDGPPPHSASRNGED